jgi:hypothetical protein
MSRRQHYSSAGRSKGSLDDQGRLNFEAKFQSSGEESCAVRPDGFARCQVPVKEGSTGGLVRNGQNKAAFPCMTDLMIIESSLQIAWDYLERTGELDDPWIAGAVLTRSMQKLIRHGERRPLMLSNRAIIEYEKFRREAA